MAVYSVDLKRATLTTSEAMGVLQCTVTLPRRLKLYKALFGCVTAGTDEQFETLFGFLTGGAPTGGMGVTPTVFQGDPASLCDATEGAITVDPTQGTDVARIPHHRRTTGVLQYDPGKEPIGTAADNAGFGVFTPVAPTVGAGLTCTIDFEEM